MRYPTGGKSRSKVGSGLKSAKGMGTRVSKGVRRAAGGRSALATRRPRSAKMALGRRR